MRAHGTAALEDHLSVPNKIQDALPIGTTTELRGIHPKYTWVDDWINWSFAHIGIWSYMKFQVMKKQAEKWMWNNERRQSENATE